MLKDSATHQQEVTDRLGYQVREAVEEIIRSLDRIDQDEKRQLLAGVSEPELYRAALTVMMRLVFLFSAEERDLLLLGDRLYNGGALEFARATSTWHGACDTVQLLKSDLVIAHPTASRIFHCQIGCSSTDDCHVLDRSPTSGVCKHSVATRSD